MDKVELTSLVNEKSPKRFKRKSLRKGEVEQEQEEQNGKSSEQGFISEPFTNIFLFVVSLANLNTSLAFHVVFYSGHHVWQ